MSYLDEVLDWAPEAIERVAGFVPDVKAARTELAALRRRAEDAEAMLRWAIRGTDRATEIVKMPPGSRREGQFVAVEWEGGFNRQRFELDADPTTGLPILTDEAREALK